MDELTTLRNQLASMKHSLDRSQIINKNLMTNVMRNRSSWLNNTVLMEVIATPVIALLIYDISKSVGISAWFAIVFFIGSAIDTAFDYKTLRIPRIWFSEMEVVALRRRLLRQKLQRKRQFIVSLPVATVWSAWFGFEYITHGIGAHIPQGPVTTASICTIVALLVIFGVWLSVAIFRKAQRTNDNLIRQLDDYSAE